MDHERNQGLHNLTNHPISCLELLEAYDYVSYNFFKIFDNGDPMKIGILGAMLEEVDLIKQLMVVTRETSKGGRIYIEGKINSVDVVVTFSQWGKVAAASTATTLINVFDVNLVLFTGVAGAVHPMLNVGDVVIGDGHYQHDMNAQPVYKKYQVPFDPRRAQQSDKILCEPHERDVAKAYRAAERFLQRVGSSVEKTLLSKHSIFQPKVYRGIIASGDQFVANPAAHANLS